MGIITFFGLFFLMSTVVTACFLIGQKKPKNFLIVSKYWVFGLFLWPLYLIVGLDQPRTISGKAAIGVWILTGVLFSVAGGLFRSPSLIRTPFCLLLFAFGYCLLTAIWLFLGIGAYNLFRSAAKLLHLPLKPIED